MDVRKVNRYSPPSYPDKPAVQQDPYLLHSVPDRWKRNASAYAALAATSAMLLSSCSIPAGKNGGTPAPTLLSVPFFEHGNGFGGFGCVSVAPPAFLSESEAFTVIREEAEKEGIVFAQDGKKLEGIRIPKLATGPDTSNESIVGYEKGTLKLDGYDGNKKLAYEFVSAEDIEAWCAKPSNATATVYPFIQAAKALNKSLNEAKTEIPVAVFYDPNYKYEDVKQIIEDNRGDYTVMEQKLKEHIKEDLCAQVRDFIAWLKAAGII